MTDVSLLLVTFGQAHEQQALALLLGMIRRARPGASVRGAVVDNSLAGDVEQEIGGGFHRVNGDNSLHEFSGWDRGLGWLEKRYAPQPDSIVVLANDTVVRSDKHDRVRDTAADRVTSAADGALVGWLEEYPRPIELFGLTLRQWVDTSLLLTSWRTLATLTPLARELDDDSVFGDDCGHFFRQPSPLSENYQAYLRTYFFGEQLDSNFRHRWHAQVPLTELNVNAFKTKLRCVFCEHLLSARAQANGIPLIDIRPTALRHPKVSVIVPCHNLGAYLDEAVDSVLAQTYQDFEIVIVDDGSTDPSTVALLADYQRPKTRVIHTAHGGVSAARNLAIANATGAYVCALDADDRLDPSYFEKAVPVLDGDPSVAFVSSWLRTFGDEEWVWKPERCDLPTLLWEDTVLTAALVRRETVLKVGGYDTNMPVQGAEDWDFWLTVAAHGYRGVILREVLFEYRRRADSLSTVSWYGSGHLPLTGYRVAKHADTYRKYLIDVLLHQDAETASLLQRNDDLERAISSELEPAVAARREELSALQAKLAALSAPKPPEAAPSTAELAAALHAAEREIMAFRRSMSWRLTRPLRDAYGWWLRRGGPA